MLGALRYEWRRLWSVRSTWIMSFVYLAFLALIGIGPLYAVKSSDPDLSQSWTALFATSTSGLVVFFLSVVGASAFGHEYRYGTIRLALTSFPKREQLLVAKVLVLAVYSTLMVLLGWAVLWALGSTLLSGIVSSDAVGSTLFGETPPYLWQVPVYSFAYCLLAFSLTLLMRNLALGIVIPLLLSILIEPLLSMLTALGGKRWSWVDDVLPMTNGNSWLAPSDVSNKAGLVFALWVIGLHLIAVIGFAKRDA